MLPKHVRYQTALHPVVPVSLACPAGDFLSIHPFQQFVNPQNEFFCGFFDSFWAFFGKSPQMPAFSAFFRFSRRSSGAFSAHILLQSLLRDHAEAQKGGSSRNLGGRAAWGARLRTRKIRGRDASLPAPLLAASLGLVGRGTVGALPQTPQETLSLDPARGRRKGTKSPPLDPFSRLSWSRFHAPFACSFFGASPKPLFAPPNFP